MYSTHMSHVMIKDLGKLRQPNFPTIYNSGFNSFIIEETDWSEITCYNTNIRSLKMNTFTKMIGIKKRT